MKPVVLFCNHRTKSCGVHMYGERLFKQGLKSQKYNCYYIDVDRGDEFDYWCNELQPEIVLYNFYFSGSTMNWLSQGKVASQKSRFKQLSVHHEGDVSHMGFDAIVHQDPTYVSDGYYFPIPRPIPDHKPVKWQCDIPVISSFGFGLGGKGFTRIIEQVKQEFDRAIIRLHIPYAAFGDSEGTGAKSWIDACRKLLEGSEGISLQVSHNLLSEEELVDWLAMSTVNCFFYDANIGRGLSGTLDYALAADKPIAITYSDQFRHFEDAPIHIEEYTLQQIIGRGTKPLEVYKERWNSQQVVKDFETIFDNILRKEQQ